MKLLKGYIITDYTDQDKIYVADRLIEESKNLKIDLEIIKPQDCFLFKNGSKTEILQRSINGYEVLQPSDFAIVRSHDGLMKNEIIKLCKCVYNDQLQCDFFHNKFNQVSTLKGIKHQLNIIDSVLVPFQKKYSKDDLSVLYAQLHMSLGGTPFVLKDLLGHGGSGVFLVNNGLSFLKMYKDYNLQNCDLLAQKFIKESYGSDIRVFIIHGKAIAAMRRTSQSDDFRSNFSLGGKVEEAEITSTIENIAANLYKQTKLEIFGIDLLDSKLPDEHYLCELNVNPGFEGIELATGKNIAYEILSFIKKDIAKKNKKS